MLNKIGLFVMVGVGGLIVLSTMAFVIYHSFKPPQGDMREDIRINQRVTLYEIWDSISVCRARIDDSVKGVTSSIVVDNRSSFFDYKRNQNVVFFDMDLIGRKSLFGAKISYSAKIVCRTHASTNRIVHFDIKPLT